MRWARMKTEAVRFFVDEGVGLGLAGGPGVGVSVRDRGRGPLMTKIPALARPEDLDMPPCSCGVLRVFRTLMKSGVSDAWGRSPIMSASKCGAEFTEQVVPRDRSTVPAGGRDREALRAGPLRTVGGRSRDGAQSTQGRGRGIPRTQGTPETTTVESGAPARPGARPGWKPSPSKEAAALARPGSPR